MNYQDFLNLKSEEELIAYGDFPVFFYEKTDKDAEYSEKIKYIRKKLTHEEFSIVKTYGGIFAPLKYFRGPKHDTIVGYPNAIARSAVNNIEFASESVENMLKTILSSNDLDLKKKFASAIIKLIPLNEVKNFPIKVRVIRDNLTNLIIAIEDIQKAEHNLKGK